MLRIDPVTRATTKLALKKWYYRDTVPVGKSLYLGCWEDSVFFGVLVFGYSASANLGTRWGWSNRECVELLRIALGTHETPTSRILSIGCKQLKKLNPGLRAVITFCDPTAGHVGTVYRAAGWIPLGETAATPVYRDRRTGEIHHSRDVRPGGTRTMPGGVVGKCIAKEFCDAVAGTPKLRFGYPLDSEAREILSSRGTCVGGADSGVTRFRRGGDGANPIPTLQKKPTKQESDCACDKYKIPPHTADNQRRKDPGNPKLENATPGRSTTGVQSSADDEGFRTLSWNNPDIGMQGVSAGGRENGDDALAAGTFCLGPGSDPSDRKAFGHGATRTVRGTHIDVDFA